MSETMCTVTVDGKTGRFAQGTCFGEILRELLPGELDETLLVLVNGRLRELHKPLQQDCSLKRITYNSEIGRGTYKRSLNYLFLKFHLLLLLKPNLKKLLLFLHIMKLLFL